MTVTMVTVNGDALLIEKPAIETICTMTGQTIKSVSSLRKAGMSKMDVTHG